MSRVIAMALELSGQEACALEHSIRHHLDGVVGRPSEVHRRALARVLAQLVREDDE